jgi:mono/diheme cytochrome c family protein
MKKCKVLSGGVGAAAVFLFFFVGMFSAPLSLTAHAKDSGKNVPDSGKRVYESRCAVCHSVKGDGNGVIGIVDKGAVGNKMWAVYPRDFTVGVYKFRSTGTGCLPVQSDIENIVKNGVLKAGMPSHKDVSDADIKAVIGYVKTFSSRWKDEEPCKTISAKKPKSVGSAESVKKGEEVYTKMKCWECHGKEGKGDGPKSNEIKDDWGKPILPFDFTTGELKRGSTPENVYMTFTTGLDGTGMPSYEDSLNEEQRWSLVSYTLKLMNKVK